MVVVITSVLFQELCTFFGIWGSILKNDNWFKNCICCSIQQNQLEASIIICLGTVGEKMWTIPETGQQWLSQPFFPLRGLFSGNRGSIYKNDKWFINYIFRSIQKNKPNISIIFLLGAGGDWMSTYFSQATAMIATTIFPFETAFPRHLWTDLWKSYMIDKLHFLLYSVKQTRGFDHSLFGNCGHPFLTDGNNVHYHHFSFWDGFSLVYMDGFLKVKHDS